MSEYIKICKELDLIQNQLKELSIYKDIINLKKQKTKLAKELYKTYNNNPKQLEIDTQGKLTFEKKEVLKKPSLKQLKKMVEDEIGFTNEAKQILNLIESNKVEKKELKPTE